MDPLKGRQCFEFILFLDHLRQIMHHMRFITHHHMSHLECQRNYSLFLMES